MDERNAKKPTGEKVFISIIVVVALAIAGLGGYGIYEKVKQNKAEEEAWNQMMQQMQQEQSAPTTVETIAAAEGLSAEEFLKKIGLEDSGLTGQSTEQELQEKVTIENYALLKNMTVEDFKKMFGIEHLDNSMLWTEAQMKVPMGKVAEVEYQIPFDQFALEQGLPEEITAETTFEEAVAIMEAQASSEATETPAE